MAMYTIKPVTDVLGSTLGGLSWEKRSKIYEAASEVEIDVFFFLCVCVLFDMLKNLEPNFDKKKMQQKHLNNYLILQQVLKFHCQRHHYLFTMKRCEEQDCAVCYISCDYRISTNLLDSLNTFPFPVDSEKADH